MILPQSGLNIWGLTQRYSVHSPCNCLFMIYFHVKVMDPVMCSLIETTMNTILISSLFMPTKPTLE